MPKRVYRNSQFSVEELEMRRKGVRYNLYRVKLPPVAVVLPIFNSDEMLLERQYRGVLGRYMYEVPAGHAKSGESLISCARRELEEETGYRAETIKPMLYEYPAPGSMTEKRSYFVATGLRKGASSPDRSEDIAAERVGIGRVLRMIRQNRISDGKTIVAVLFYTAMKKNGHGL
jgi:ADP-ribose pyrophosphatase